MNHTISAEFEASRQRSWPAWKTSPAPATIAAKSPKPSRRSASSPTLDGRRVLAELQKVLKNIDEHPSQLIFGH